MSETNHKKEIEESQKFSQSEHPDTPTLKAKYYWTSFHQNVLRNARIYTVIIIGIMFYMVSQFSYVYQELDKINKTISEVGQGVITVTEDGRVVELIKEGLKPEEYANIVATIIERYLPRSKGNLLAPKYNNPAVDNAMYKNWTELFKYHKGTGSLQELYHNFIDKKREDPNVMTQGEEYFKAYLTKLIIGIRRNETPFTLDIIKTEYDPKEWIVN